MMTWDYDDVDDAKMMSWWWLKEKQEKIWVYLTWDVTPAEISATDLAIVRTASRDQSHTWVLAPFHMRLTLVRQTYACIQGVTYKGLQGTQGLPQKISAGT